MKIANESKSLLEAINRISQFSYELFITKYPFLKDYLSKEKDSKAEWVLWMTSAGAGYALTTKEAYPGEHDELIKSITAINGLPKIVENFTIYIQDVYKNNSKLYPFGIGFWVITKIKNGKPTIEESEGLGLAIGKILNSTIQDYEAKKLER